MEYWLVEGEDAEKMPAQEIGFRFTTDGKDRVDLIWNAGPYPQKLDQWLDLFPHSIKVEERENGRVSRVGRIRWVEKGYNVWQVAVDWN